MPSSQKRDHRGAVSRSGTAYIRTRTASACQVCRARRAKCDDERPCASCRRIGATCTSDPDVPSTGFDPASLAILAAVRDLAGDIKALASRTSHVPSQVEVASTSPLSSTHGSLVPDLQPHLQRGNLAQVLAWNVWGPHTPSSALEALDAEHLIPQQTPVEPHVVLEFSQFPGYLDAFFRNVHILNPVLEEERMRSQLNMALLGGFVSQDAASSLLLLVLANGACSTDLNEPSAEVDSRQHIGQSQESAKALFSAAVKRRDTLLYADHLTQARCSFYSGVYMMVSMRPFEAWRHFLTGLATCQFFAKKHQTHGSTQAQKQAEESIYWSCWKSERELRFELDMPDFTSAAHDYPAMFPALPEVPNHPSLRTWYFYLAEISLWRLEMTARQSMSDLVHSGSRSVDDLARQVHGLEASLSSWRDSLPDSIRLDADADMTDLLTFVLKGRLSYNQEVITWPFLEILVLSEENVSEMVFELTVKAVQAHYDRLVLNRPGFYFLHHGTWLMQCSSARSVFVLLAVARSRVAHLLPADWLIVTLDTIAMLEYWENLPNKDAIGLLKNLVSEFRSGT